MHLSFISHNNSPLGGEFFETGKIVYFGTDRKFVNINEQEIIIMADNMKKMGKFTERLSNTKIPTVEELLKREIRNDISAFPEDLCDDIKDRFERGVINPAMFTPVQKAVEDWWKNKFSVPFGERESILKKRFLDSQKKSEEKVLRAGNFGEKEPLEKSHSTEKMDLNKIFKEVRQEKPKTFLVSKVSRAQKVVKVLTDELGKLSMEDKKIVDRFEGNEWLRSWEANRFSEIISAVWEKKYGFSFEVEDEVDKLLNDKYPEDNSATSKLEQLLVDALVEKDEVTVEKVKEFYLEIFPDQLHGVEIIFAIPQFLRKQELAESGLLNRAGYEDLTEDRFIISNFVLNNSQDKDLLNSFWLTLDLIAQEMKFMGTDVNPRSNSYPRYIDSLRSSVLSELAAYDTLKKIGLRPKLASPRQDAFEGVDLLEGDNNAFQILGDYTVFNGPAFVDLNTVSDDFISLQKTRAKEYDPRAKKYRDAQVKMPSGQVVSAKLFDKIVKMKTKLNQLENSSGRKLNGFLLNIPHEEFNQLSGLPSNDLLVFVKDRIKIVDFDSGFGTTSPEWPSSAKFLTAHDFYRREFLSNLADFPRDIQSLVRFRYQSGGQLDVAQIKSLKQALDAYCTLKFGLKFTKDKDVLVRAIREKYYPSVN
ncbi:MAG: hypothetical protein HY225_03270 [Candidatus Vogelbacteria bacterium]|nr:hypothetical protein [Candidatus Vogelbacteria bacterium]